ncbi:MAG: hypothetical protein ACM3KM_02965 [Acidobacteriaceae bacterium]
MNKTTSIIVGIIVVAVVVVGAVFLSRNKNNPASTGNNSTVTSTGRTVTVSYDGSSFSPSLQTVNKGDTVKFVNNSSANMWVASDPHPLHNGYPTTGGCVASTFDACTNITPGNSFSFQFDIVGSWGYHNHLNPAQKGTIVVQ